MPNIRVLSENKGVVAADLVADLVAETGLDEAEANALVRVILQTVPNADCGGGEVHRDLFAKIARVLRAHGYVVSVE